MSPSSQPRDRLRARGLSCHTLVLTDLGGIVFRESPLQTGLRKQHTLRRRTTLPPAAGFGALCQGPNTPNTCPQSGPRPRPLETALAPGPRRDLLPEAETSRVTHSGQPRSLVNPCNCLAGPAEENQATLSNLPPFVHLYSSQTSSTCPWSQPQAAGRRGWPHHPRALF